MLAAASAATATEQAASPGRLAIFYGIPSLVNGASGDVERAAREFAPYDVIVFGDGLQYESRSGGAREYQRTTQIIKRLSLTRPSARVFGYIPLGSKSGLSDAQVSDAIERWDAMAVHGVFLDEAGSDFGVTRSRQTSAIDTAHAAGLHVFVNAFDPDDVLAEGTHLTTGDLFLLESFTVRNGNLEPEDEWFSRARKADAHSRRTGVEVWTVTTPAANGRFDKPLCTLAWWSAVLWGFNGFGWGERFYAAPSSTMPMRDCRGEEIAAGGVYASDVAREGTRFTRRTQDGHVEVDLGRRVGRFVR
jgi:hypothetical protein